MIIENAHPTGNQSLIVQAMASVSLLAELSNADFLNSEYFEKMHFDNESYKCILKQSGIGNPAVMHFALCQEDIAGTIPWLVGMVIAVVVVYLLSFVMPEKVLGRLVNAVCVAGTLIFLYVGYEMLSAAIERDFHIETEQPAVEEKQS